MATFFLNFRSVAYDSSLGACLQALHSCCSDDVVRSTAADIMPIFSQTMLKTGSLELKVINLSCCVVFSFYEIE